MVRATDCDDEMPKLMAFILFIFTSWTDLLIPESYCLPVTFGFFIWASHPRVDVHFYSILQKVNCKLTIKYDIIMHRFSNVFAHWSVIYGFWSHSHWNMISIDDLWRNVVSCAQGRLFALSLSLFLLLSAADETCHRNKRNLIIHKLRFIDDVSNSSHANCLDC